MGQSTAIRTTRGRRRPASTYPVWHGWPLLLKDLGVEPAGLLVAAQLPAHLFSEPGMFLEAEAYFRLWTALDAAVDALGGGVPLPIRMASVLSTEWLDPALFAALSSADLNQALSRIAQYKRLVCPMSLDLDITAEGTSLRLVWLDALRAPPEVLVLFELAFFVQLARLATRHAVQPMAVTCPSLPERLAPYIDYFGCPLQPGAAATLCFSAEDASRPFLTANDGMWAFLEPALQKLLSRVQPPSSAAQQVRRALLAALPAGNVTMDGICRQLGMSARTLQRRLRHEGTSFQKTLDEVRRSVAEHYLEHSSLTGSEISFLLGYEDPNSFVRAFQAWTGQTPGAAREDVSGK